jgi:hypothetical protein
MTMSPRVHATLAALTIAGAIGLGVAAFGGPPAWSRDHDPPSLEIVPWVDTRDPDVAGIVAIVERHLARAYSAPVDTALFSREDPRDRRWGDLARPLTTFARPTLVAVIPTSRANDRYIVRIMYNSQDGGGNMVPFALQRLAVVREEGEWRFRSMLPLLTRDWPMRRVGRINFWYAPGQLPRAGVAEHASAFVDSVATALEFTLPDQIDYYVAGSAEETYRILGLDLYPLPSGREAGRGGRMLAREGVSVVLSGDAEIGEGYLHELAHVATAGDRIRSRTVSEGVAAWLGGSRGYSRDELFRRLAAYQKANPATRFAQLLEGKTPRGRWSDSDAEALNTTGALMVDAVYRKAGLPGLRRLMASEDGAARLTKILREELDDASLDPDRWWRAEGAAAAGR